MPDENNANQQQPPSPPAAAPVVDPPAPPAPPGREPKVLTIPSSAMTQIKAGERERGKEMARRELEAQAKSLGFRSLEDMQQAALRTKQGGGNQRQPPPKGKQKHGRPAAPPATTQAAPTAPAQNGDRALRRSERREQALLEDKKRLNRSLSFSEKRRKELEREMSAQQAESALKLEAVRAGVKDPEYAVELLRRQMAGKTAKELEAFDEAKFFAETLRKSHPYLYGVEVAPATTGNGGQASPPPPPSPTAAGRDQPATQNGGSVALDARKLSREEFQKLLRDRGITDPAVGSTMS